MSKYSSTEMSKYLSAQTRWEELGVFPARVAEFQVLVQVFKHVFLCIFNLSEKCQQKRQSVSKNILKLNREVFFQNYKTDREEPGAQHSPIPNMCPQTWMASVHVFIGLQVCMMYWKGRGKEVKLDFLINKYPTNCQRFCEITETAKGKSVGSKCYYQVH